MTSFVVGRFRSSEVRFRVITAVVAVIVAALTWVLVTSPTVKSAAGTVPPHGSVLASSTGGPTISAMSPELARIAGSDPRRLVEAIIQLRRGVNAIEGRALVRSLGGRPELELHIINGFSARLTAGAARQLAESRLVRAVSLNAVIRESTIVNLDPKNLATVFNQSVRATSLWNRSTGKGVGVAVIDTGITGSGSDFRTSQTASASRVIASAVVDPNATTAGDAYGHGTVVGGLIAGNGGNRDAGDPERGKYAGSAPDASLISIKIGDDSGQATTLDAIYGLQFAVDHRDDYNIGVINMSFRSTSAESYQTDPLDAAAEQAWFDGIVVVAAAGNLGTTSDAVSYAPGNDPYVITVGAVDDQGTKSPADDVETGWSSRGETQDGVAKPDVLAPGNHIVSTLAPDSAFTTLCPSCIVGGSYFQASGTSLAAPIVSGVVADLRAAHPNWTPDMVKGAIVNTALPVSADGSELNAYWANWAFGGQLDSNRGLTPNDLVNPNAGTIDPTLASWSAASWSAATSPQLASWSLASWSCSDCSSDGGGSGSVNPTLASWSIGWATMWG